MQAVEIIDTYPHWITVLIVLLLVFVLILKMLDANRLKSYLLSYSKRAYIYFEIEKNTTFTDVFYSIIFIFSTVVFSLVAYKIYIAYFMITDIKFSNYLKVLTCVFSYLFIKRLLEEFLGFLFLIQNHVRIFIVSKNSYLFSISLVLFVAFIITQYSSISLFFLIYISLALLIIRYLYIIKNNKKLFLNKLFYFILYLCVFEIAPLFIILKLIF